MRSIRQLLLVSIIGVGSLLLLIASAWSYRIGLQEAEELFDAKLAHSARVLMSLIDTPLHELERGSEGSAEHGSERGHDSGGSDGDRARVVEVWHGSAGGEGRDLALPGGHAYETKLAFQVRAPDGRLLLRSDSGPDAAFAPLRPGYADTVADGERWRTFVLHAPSGYWYQTAEQAAIRSEIAEEIALGIALPLLLALPVLALCVWLAVAWAVRGLGGVSQAVDQRSLERLDPIRPARVPQEVAGLVLAINALLARLAQARERERRFVADAAHELRTPIAALKLHAWNVAEAADAEERAQSQRLLDAGIRRMERLVEQLLALSRLDDTLLDKSALRTGAAHPAAPAPLAEIDLAALVRRLCEELSAVDIARTRHLRVDLRPARLHGHEAALEALVRNLVDNALRYTPSGGTVRVSLHADTDTDTDTDADTRTGTVAAHGLRLVVEDSGPGIPEAARERVFERFRRELGTQAEGSGLGLSIVALALQLHGGTIALDTSPELGGLRVTVRLPAAADAAPLG